MLVIACIIYIISQIYQHIHSNKIKNLMQGIDKSCVFQHQGIIFRALQIQKVASSNSSMLELQCRVWILKTVKYKLVCIQITR
jgi:hypothetical protein